MTPVSRTIQKSGHSSHFSDFPTTTVFSFVDPTVAIALLVSFVIDTVKDEKTKWYEFGRESLMSCLVEVSR